MSLLPDAGIDPCQGANWPGRGPKPSISSLKKRPAKKQSLLGPLSPPSLSSIVKASWEWAEDSYNSYWDGLTREERKERMDREDRKQVLYVRMRNVSVNRLYLEVSLFRAGADSVGRFVRSMAGLRM